MPNSGEKLFCNAGWAIRTAKGPIMGDRETDDYRRLLSALVLPEMVFAQNVVELKHQASGTVICFNAFDALAGWKHEDLAPLQVRVAEEWRRAREHEIQQQKAVQLTYDWTFTTPYTCTVVPPPSPAAAPSSAAASPSPSPAPPPAAAAGAKEDARAGEGAPAEDASSHAGGAPSPSAAQPAASPHGVPDFVCSPRGDHGMASPSAAPPPPAAAHGHGHAHGHAHAHAAGHSGANGAPTAAAAVAMGPPATAATAPPPPPCTWHPTADQIDRGLLMERDPILFYDEIPLYESDLDDNGVCAVTVKLRVMPRCWLVLLRTWVRVDGSMVRLREARLFCRHDRPDKRLEVLQEVKHCEGRFSELRAKGAPDEGPAYADADAASQVFQAVAPVGLCLLQTRKLLLPASAR